MPCNQEKMPAGGTVILLFLLSNAVVLEQGLVSNPNWYKLGYLSLPLLLISLIAFRKRLL